MLKKVICNILFVIFFVGILCADTENVKADPVSSEEVEVYFTDDTPTGKLTDDNFNTYTDVSGKTLVIENTKNVAGIYFKWDQPVGDYYIYVDDTNGITCDVNMERIPATEIIHQYVDLYYGGETIEIVMPENAKLCDIYFMDFGSLPEWVQVWNAPYESADMLFIPTHADDELLFFGGAMPYYAGELGMKVQVAYMTNHWGERYRPHELLDGLWTCGVTAYPIIGPFTDYYSESLEHAKTLYPEEDVIGFMVEIIRRFKPYVILGHDINGEYGHGVHMYNTDALMKALEISNDSTQYLESAEEYGLWDVPKTYFHLYKENQIVMKWDTPLERFGGLDGVEVAALAFECHPSQNIYYSVKRAPGSVYGCTEFGLYRTTVGLDIAKNDFLENVEFVKEEENNKLYEKGREEISMSEIKEPLYYAKASVETMMRKFPAEELPPKGRFHYHQGVFLSGVYKTYQACGDERYFQYVKDWVDSCVDENGHIIQFNEGQLDDLQPGILLYPLLDKTGDERYKKALDTLLAILKDFPRNEVGGFWHKVTCQEQMWLDGLYMGGPIAAEYGARFDASEFTEIVIEQALLMEEKTKDDATGLWYHAWDCAKEQAWADPETGLSAEFWGRSIGWVPVAILDDLDFIPKEHPKYKEMERLVRDLLIAICKYQSEQGRWYQVVDKGGMEGNWLETSCSCLYVAAICKAVRMNILPEEYMEYAKKGYEGVISSLGWEGDDLLVGDVCIGTGVGDYEHYCNRPVSTNDLHGVGAFLIMCAEMQKSW